MSLKTVKFQPDLDRVVDAVGHLYFPRGAAPADDVATCQLRPHRDLDIER